MPLFFLTSFEKTCLKKTVQQMRICATTTTTPRTTTTTNNTNHKGSKEFLWFNYLCFKFDCTNGLLKKEKQYVLNKCHARNASLRSAIFHYLKPLGGANASRVCGGSSEADVNYVADNNNNDGYKKDNDNDNNNL